MSRTVKDILKNPLLLFMTLGHRELLNWMKDETYLKIAFRASMGKKLNLEEIYLLNLISNFLFFIFYIQF